MLIMRKRESSPMAARTLSGLLFILLCTALVNLYEKEGGSLLMFMALASVASNSDGGDTCHMQTDGANSCTAGGTIEISMDIKGQSEKWSEYTEEEMLETDSTLLAFYRYYIIIITELIN